MAGGWFAKRFPRRLDAVTGADLARMAWNPSYRAPHPAELLDPGPFTPPGPPPMPPAERALLDGVLAEPAADEPRLRFADYCDRQGDPRGEFIRAQISLADEPRGLPPRTPTAGVNPAARQAELLAAHRERWLAPFAPWSARDVVFRRGFAEAMSLAGRAFISIGDGLFRTAPVRDVRLVAVQPFLDELARAPNLAKLDRLDLRGNWIGPEGVRELAGSPFCTNLRALDLSRNGLGGDGLRALLAAPWRGQLRSLSLADNGLTADDARRLRDDPALAGLAELDLSGNGLGADGERALRERFGEAVLLR